MYAQKYTFEVFPISKHANVHLVHYGKIVVSVLVSVLIAVFMQVVAAFSCNPATLKVDCQNCVRLMLGGCNRWMDCVSTCNPMQGEESD